MHSLAGVYSAAVTPLKQDYSPNLEAIPSLMEFLAGRGCHGILLLGTTGEGPSFSPDERLGILRAACQARSMQALPHSQNYRLLAGTGTPSLSETIALTHSAFDLGCEGVVVLPPFYYRKASDEGLFLYFSEIINKAIPNGGYLLGYHIPGTAGIGFSIDLLARLKDAFPVQFAGIKDSSHDSEFARKLGEQFGSDLLVLTGTNSYLQSALESHAQGCITAPANLISPELRQIWNAFQEGKDVSTLQERVTEIRKVLEKYPPFPPAIKLLLSKLYGFPRWPVRPPLVEISPELKENLLAEYSTVNR